MNAYNFTDPLFLDDDFKRNDQIFEAQNLNNDILEDLDTFFESNTDLLQNSIQVHDITSEFELLNSDDVQVEEVRKLKYFLN